MTVVIRSRDRVAKNYYNNILDTDVMRVGTQAANREHNINTYYVRTTGDGQLVGKREDGEGKRKNMNTLLLLLLSLNRCCVRVNYF